MDALPGYMAATLFTNASPGPATIAPPAGTMKVLSVLWTNASTRPSAHARSTKPEHCKHCKPCALLITCGRSKSFASFAITSTRSGSRGADVEVVVQMQSTFEWPISLQAAAMPSTSVTRASVPSLRCSSTTYGVKPAAEIALKPAFLSTRDQTTCVASGLLFRKARKTKISDMPIAAGSTQHAVADSMPAIWRASRAKYLVSCTTADEPAAFGC
mmetsp:Transcript_3065/g.6897  ORF Transcript_3065/g.6897 Transcript_3065/m.6897 type:complete len:215 (-) Transcript_3065:12-656(-)